MDLVSTLFKIMGSCQTCGYPRVTFYYGPAVPSKKPWKNVRVSWWVSPPLPGHLREDWVEQQSFGAHGNLLPSVLMVALRLSI